MRTFFGILVALVLFGALAYVMGISMNKARINNPYLNHCMEHGSYGYFISGNILFCTLGETNIMFPLDSVVIPDAIDTIPDN